MIFMIFISEKNGFKSDLIVFKFVIKDNNHSCLVTSIHNGKIWNVNVCTWNGRGV